MRCYSRGAVGAARRVFTAELQRREGAPAARCRLPSVPAVPAVPVRCPVPTATMSTGDT